MMISGVAVVQTQFKKLRTSYIQRFPREIFVSPGGDLFY